MVNLSRLKSNHLIVSPSVIPVPSLLILEVESPMRSRFPSRSNRMIWRRVCVIPILLRARRCPSPVGRNGVYPNNFISSLIHSIPSSINIIASQDHSTRKMQLNYKPLSRNILEVRWKSKEKISRWKLLMRSWYKMLPFMLRLKSHPSAHSGEESSPNKSSN